MTGQSPGHLNFACPIRLITTTEMKKKSDRLNETKTTYCFEFIILFPFKRKSLINFSLDFFSPNLMTIHSFEKIIKKKKEKQF